MQKIYAICLDLNNYFDLKVWKREHPLTKYVDMKGKEGEGPPNVNGTTTTTKEEGDQNSVKVVYG